jgi:hypothetical protein
MRPKGISQIVRVAVLSTAVLVVVWGAGLHSGSGVVEAQKSGGQGKVPPNLQNGPTTLPNLDQPAVVDPMRAHMDEERVKAMNDDRQKRLAADIDRLQELTNQLKSDLDKTNKDELSVAVIRKAAEIEKLAHDVQSRMKN